MDRTQFEELLPFYALDTVSDEERELVEGYLAEHPEARQQVEAMSEAASALPLSVSPVQPPRHVKEALLARIGSPDRPQPSRGALRIGSFFRALSMGAASAALIWAVVLSIQVSHLQNEISALHEALAAQANSLNQIIANLPQGSPSGVITVSLKGTNAQPQAQGQLIADPKSDSAVLVIAGLPRLEAGKTYQVWLIDGGAPVSAGLLTVDEQGQGVLVVTSREAIGSFKSLGISIEPAGGSPEPTGEIVVLSDL